MSKDVNEKNLEKWVDDRLSSLTSPSNWKPDSANALERVRARANQAGRRPTWTWTAVAVSAVAIMLLVLPSTRGIALRQLERLSGQVENVTQQELAAQSDDLMYACPPCGCSHDGEVHSEPGICPVCSMPLVETASMAELMMIANLSVRNHQVWTGGQPKPDHLLKLKEAGVRVIINLRLGSESDNAGAREAAQAEELGLNYFHLPVNYREPKSEDADEFLRITDEQLGNGPAFIHCSTGIRTSVFWMIRRILRDGWEFDRALAEANQSGLANQQHLIAFARDYIDRSL